MLNSDTLQLPLPFEAPERWLPVPGYEGLYEVSNLGHVYSFPRRGTRGGILKPQTNGHDGYECVDLTRDAIGRTFKIHQLVLLAFAGPCPAGLQVRHLDANPLNNRWAPGNEAETRAAGGNLVYGTPTENMQDRLRHGNWAIGDRRGERHPMAVLTEDLVREVRRRHSAGETIPSLASELGFSKWTLYSAARGDHWSHVA